MRWPITFWLTKMKMALMEISIRLMEKPRPACALLTVLWIIVLIV